MQTVGRHLIAEFYDCDARLIDDLAHIRESMLGAARVVGATVVGDTFHRFSPQGVSGTVVIAESHLSIHTWPERGYVAVDIFTCGGLDPHPGFDWLGQCLRAQSSRCQEIVRGLPDEVEAHRSLCAEDVQIISREIETQYGLPKSRRLDTGSLKSRSLENGS